MAQVVVVTGASAGVGRATVRAFARRGASIGLLARGRRRPGGASRRSRSWGAVRSRSRPTSPTPTQVEAAADGGRGGVRADRRLGQQRDGLGLLARSRRWSPRSSAASTEVTYLGTVYGTLAALRRMLPRDRGTIVQVGSALAYRGIPLQSAYCGAKHAIQGFCDSLRCELIHDGSRRPPDDGADAGAEHAAVRLGQEPAAAQGAAGAADLPARGRRRGDRLGRRITIAAS